MPNAVMASGTKVYTRASGVGSYVELPYVLGVTGSTISRSFSDNTAASEMTVSKVIGRVDPGTVTITMHLEDTATASNTYSGWRAGLTNASSYDIRFDMPYSADDSPATPLLEFTGVKLSSVSGIDLSSSSGLITYTITFQL